MTSCASAWTAGGLHSARPAGRVGWAHNEPNIAVAYQTTGMDAPRAFVHKDEERQTTHGA
jgi:hypothetical protein